MKYHFLVFFLSIFFAQATVWPHEAFGSENKSEVELEEELFDEDDEMEEEDEDDELLDEDDEEDDDGEDGGDEEESPSKKKFKPLVAQIKEDDILYKQRITREINLNEPANKGFFFRGDEITKHLIQAIKEGELTPYKTEKLSDELNEEEFIDNLTVPKEIAGDAELIEEDEEDDWGEASDVNTKDHSSEKLTFTPRDVSLLHLVGDLIFDKTRSVWVFSIKVIKLLIPARNFTKQVDKVVACLSYNELRRYLLASPEIVWRNKNNAAANIPAAEAFEVGMPFYKLIKIENPDDLTIEEMYPGKGDIVAKQLEERLINMEHNIWDY